MSHSRSVHVFHVGLDRLLLECVAPALERLAERPGLRWWERHPAGGPHLRVHLWGEAPGVESAAEEIRRAAEAWLAANPSDGVAGYSPLRVAALLEREGEAVDAADLSYRNNVVEVRPFSGAREGYVSDEAERLAREFRRDAGPLAVRIVGGARERREELLRLYFLTALELCGGDLAAGCVSYKSHWEGWAAHFPAPQVLERVGRNYAENRAGLMEIVREVKEAWTLGTVDADPVLGEWRTLMNRYRSRARALLEAGVELTPLPANREEAASARDDTLAKMRRDSAFVRTLWADERFVAVLRFSTAFQVPRVVTNLLYTLVAAAGLSPIDRMTLCHHAHRAAEEHTGTSLDDVLAGNIQRTVAAHEHQLDA